MATEQIEAGQAPFPRAVARFGKVRQSHLAAFDNCALEFSFESNFRRGWSEHHQGRGNLFHRVAARCLREMQAQGEETIPVDAALAILDEVIAQDDADRECPACGSERILPGLSKFMERTCGDCGGVFETEFVNVPRRHIADLVWVVKKWSHENAWDIAHLVDVERRLEATVHYSWQGCSIDRVLTGQLDVLLVDPSDAQHAIVVDFKDTWKLPGVSTISEEGFFQQRFYAWLVMSVYKSIMCVTLREFYVRRSEVREATLWRHDLDQLDAEFAALVRKFDRAYEQQVFVPSPGAHCFSGETRFLTDTGIRTLRDALGEEVRVLNRRGEWENATVRSFGMQPLLRVTFDDGSVVRATPDHRWWAMRVVQGSWVQTDERVTTVEADRVPLLHREPPRLTIESASEFVEGVRRKPYVRVVSVEADGYEEVFCAVVPGSESFTLATGIITSNCGWCTRPQKCPIPVFARGAGRITDAKRARQVGAQLIVAKRVVRASEEALKAYVAEHGPVEVKDAKGKRVYGFVESERMERPTREQIDDALLRSGGALSRTEVDALYRPSVGTRFTDHAPPEREEGADKGLIDSLAKSLARAAERKGIA